MKRKFLSLIVVLCVLLSCVAMTASADTGLTLLNRSAYGTFTATSTNWVYSVDGASTQMTDGMGGMIIGGNGRYAKIPAGSKTTRAGLVMVNKDATYFANNYLIYTVNVYGNSPFSFWLTKGNYNIDIDASQLNANQWNNFTIILDKANGEHTGYLNGQSVGTISKTIDTSGGEQLRLVLNEAGTDYYIDDLAIYSATTEPTIVMPAVTAGDKYTVSGNVITYNYGETLTEDEINVTQNVSGKRAYKSTDSTLTTILPGTDVLEPGDVLVIEAPVDTDDATDRQIDRYAYYTIAEGGIVGPEPDPEPEQIGDSSTYWIYDEATTTLTFSGTGALPDWTANSTGGVKDADHHNYRPWYDIRQDVTKVVIGEGITEVGSYTCAQFKSLKTVEFPSTLTTLGSSSFMYTGLEDVVLNDGLTTIESHAFMHQNSETTIYTPLNSITIPSSVTTIADDAFDFQRATVAIKCYSGSAARTFARNHSFRYILLDKDYELSYASTTGVASYRSFTGVDKDVVAVIFNRKSGVINDIYFETITLNGDGTVAEVTVPEDFSEEAGTATLIMLWNSWDDITPLCDYISKTH